jgi:hypothetical protein
MFIQPLGEKTPCSIDRDCVSFHQSMHWLRVLAFEEPLFNVIRQLKGTHPNLRSYRVLAETHHIPTVAKQYHWRKLAQNDVTIAVDQTRADPRSLARPIDVWAFSRLRPPGRAMPGAADIYAGVHSGPCLLQRHPPRVRTPPPATEAQPLIAHHRLPMIALGRIRLLIATHWGEA